MRLNIALTAVTVARAALADSTGCTYPSLLTATFDEISAGLEKGCFTSVDLVNAYTGRINQINGDLHAVHEINPDALAIAAGLDAERASGTTRSILHGIPILVKDNIATFDKMNNTAGSYALVGAKVPSDSGVVKRLKDAGAIILGKTNLSQWAMFRSSNSTSGWSSVAGQVYGPFYPQQDPCGSSSGSGIAAGIGLSFAALGTETRGSILEPASRSNAVGIKPSVGLTSRHLVVPLTEFQDTVGPLAHSVRSAAAVLSIIAGLDENDEATSAIPNGGVIPDYVAATEKYTDLKGVRIGVPRNGFSNELLYQSINETVIMAAFEQALDALRSLGAEIVDAANFSSVAVDTFLHGLGTPDVTNEVISCGSGFLSGIPEYFSQLTHNPHNISSVADLVEFTKTDPREAYPDRDVAAWEGALSLGYGADDPRAQAVHEDCIASDAEGGGVTGTLRALGLDALLIPTDYAPTWASSPGLPAISVPLGAYPADAPVITGLRELIDVAPGIPFGVTFLGARWSEETLIGIAHVFEQATLYRDAVDMQGSGVTLPSIEIGDVLGGASPPPSGDNSTASYSASPVPTSSSSGVSTSSMAAYPTGSSTTAPIAGGAVDVVDRLLMLLSMAMALTVVHWLV